MKQDSFEQLVNDSVEAAFESLDVQRNSEHDDSIKEKVKRKIEGILEEEANTDELELEVINGEIVDAAFGEYGANIVFMKDGEEKEIVFTPREDGTMEYNL